MITVRLCIFCQNWFSGEQYNIGGGTEIPNIEIVKMICGYLDEIYPIKIKYSSFISYVKDRPG